MVTTLTIESESSYFRIWKAGFYLFGSVESE